MKKIIIVCMLAISFIATAQLSKSNHSNFIDTLIGSLYNDILIDSLTSEVIEEDALFDFDTKEYLPLGFDANMTFEEKYEIVYEINLEEADEAFDFNTVDYLPVGFNLNKNISNSIVEIVVEEKDESFDFDTKKYLPVGFNLNKNILNSIVEIVIEEEDESFDFDIKKYLPIEFDTNKGLSKEKKLII